MDQFGFSSALKRNVKGSSIAAEYVLSAWRPFEMFNYAPENQQEWGIPRDAGLRELSGWQNEFGTEFANRLLAAPEDPELMQRVPDFFYDLIKVGKHGAALENDSRSCGRNFWLQARESPIEFDGGALDALKKAF